MLFFSWPISVDTAFEFFEANDIYPTIEQLKSKYEERVRGVILVKPIETLITKEERKGPVMRK